MYFGVTVTIRVDIVTLPVFHSDFFWKVKAHQGIGNNIPLFIKHSRLHRKVLGSVCHFLSGTVHLKARLPGTGIRFESKRDLMFMPVN